MNGLKLRVKWVSEDTSVSLRAGWPNAEYTRSAGLHAPPLYKYMTVWNSLSCAKERKKEVLWQGSHRSLRSFKGCEFDLM